MSSAPVKSRLAGERGMTMIEVVVAMFLLLLASMAILNLVDTSTRATFRAEQGQVVSNELQDELERIKQLPFDEVALAGVPAGSGDPANPASRVAGTSFTIDRDAVNYKPLVYNGSSLQGGGLVAGGTIPAGATAFANGDVAGAVHRYVVWENDDSCSEALCPGAQDFKRVVVAASLDETPSGGIRRYQELHARLVDPDAQPVDNENPIPPGEEPSPWTFWLTDTPCNNTARQPITGNHLTHNTRGVCSAGLRTGTSPGAPDLMFDEAPPIESEQPLYDYATDVEPTQNPTGDRGLTLLREGSNGCLVNSTLDILNLGDLLAILGDNDRYQKVHKWVSPPVPNGFNIHLNGEGTISLWTKTVNGATHPGKLCIILFRRQLGLLGIPVDVPAVNLHQELLNLTYFTYSQSQWPTEWTEIQIPLTFVADLQLLPGTRLGLAIAVERQNTSPGSGIEFMYDTPSFDSRLEVTSDSLLP